MLASRLLELLGKPVTKKVSSRFSKAIGYPMVRRGEVRSAQLPCNVLRQWGGTIMNASITITGTPRKTRDQESVLKILESNWQAEMGGYHTYETLSERENDPQRRSALRGLAYAEKHHADLWSDRIAALGGPQPAYNGRETGEAAHQFQQEDERVHADGPGR